jgi:hypothetical protein
MCFRLNQKNRTAIFFFFLLLIGCRPRNISTYVGKEACELIKDRFIDTAAIRFIEEPPFYVQGFVVQEPNGQLYEAFIEVDKPRKDIHMSDICHRKIYKIERLEQWGANSAGR